MEATDGETGRAQDKQNVSVYYTEKSYLVMIAQILEVSPLGAGAVSVSKGITRSQWPND